MCSSDLDGGRSVGGEDETSRRLVLEHQIAQSRLVDGNLPLLEPFDLGGIDINASNAIAAVSEASAGDQSYVACANDRDTHSFTR